MRSNVRLAVPDGDRASLVVDHQDWFIQHRIHRVTFDLVAGQAARMTVELVPGQVLIEGVAEIQQVGEELDLRGTVLQFLGAINPQALEAAALARGGLLEGTGTETMGESFLGALKAMAGGD